MLEPRIQQQFFDTADALVQSAEPLSRPIAAAADLVLAAVTGGGKLLMVGTGLAHADALHAAAQAMGGGHRRRPGLPALTLGADPAVAAVLAQDAGIGEGAEPLAALAQQVRAFGLPGDLLVVFEAPPAPGVAQHALAPLIEAAHEREMSVVLWTACLRDSGGSPSAELLTDIDVHIQARVDRLALAGAIYRLGWLALADALDLQLLGETE